MQERYELFYAAKPWTLNAERAFGHWSKRGEVTAQWRRDFKILARQSRVPPMKSVRLEIRHICRGRLPDALACAGAAKAAIDGIVDAGVLPDDSPSHVRSIEFSAPEKGEVDGLVVVIEEAEEDA